MKKIFFLLILMLGFVSCQEDSVETNIIQEEINLEDIEKKAFESFQKNHRDIQTYTDESGRIEFILKGEFFYASEFSDPNLLSGTVYTPEGYLCIGGFVYGGSKQFATASAPLTGADTFKGWRGEMKAHLYPITPDNNTYMIVSTLGIRLKDNNGNYIPAEELKKHLKLVSRTSSFAAHPSTSASVSGDYILVGGGAKVNRYPGPGNLLIHSYPSGNSWRVRSKDHILPSPATITAYAIGMKSNIPNFGSITNIITSDCKNTEALKVGHASDRSFRNTGGRITGVGVKISANGNGRLLKGLAYNIDGIGGTGVSDQDVYAADSGNICAYTIGIKKTP